MSDIQFSRIQAAYDQYQNQSQNAEIAIENTATFYTNGKEIRCISKDQKIGEKGFKKISNPKILSSLYQHVVKEKQKIDPKYDSLLTVCKNRIHVPKHKWSFLNKLDMFLSRTQNLFTIHKFKTSNELMKDVENKLSQ